MWKKIESSYFTQLIFSYLYPKKKLIMVKINKNLQMNLNINILTYKNFSGRYIIYESNGIVKEYDGENDKLIFEGEYLNGKKNGKGIEYFYDVQLYFEGQYLNNKKHGLGKEYYNDILLFEGVYLYDCRIKGKFFVNGILEYEGEYLYDRKYNGKGYDENGNVIYELINGNGKVKEYTNNCRLRFEGEYLNGLRNGKGKEYDLSCKLEFEGEYLNGKRNGKGKHYSYIDDKFHECKYLNGKKINNFSSCIII